MPVAEDVSECEVMPELRPVKKNIYRDELVVGFTGPRGAGKSIGLCYFGLGDMLAGVDVYANMEITDGTIRANDLDTSMLFAFAESLTECDAIIDEFQFYALGRESNTNRNKLLGWLGMQIRKKSMSVYYSTQNFQWLDSWWKFQTDVLVECRDLYHTPWGKEMGLGRGEEIHMKFFDMTGFVTGVTYKESGTPFGQMNIYAKALWNKYDSYALIGMDQVFQRFEIARDTYTVGRRRGNGDGEGGESVADLPPLDFSDVQKFVDDKAIMGGVLQQLREEGIERIYGPDMRRKLREAGSIVTPSRMGVLLREFGVGKHRPTNMKPVQYIIPDYARAG